MTYANRRGSIHLEDAEILEHVAHPDNQFVLRVAAPATARAAAPGMFAHLQCAPSIRLRRPLSIMRTDASGWVEFLYKPVGHGLTALSQRRVGERISLLGPIGNGFTITPDKPKVLAIGGGVGIPPMIFAAQTLKQAIEFDVTVLIGSEIAFPFSLASSRLDSPGIATAAKRSLELLNDWHIPSHLASKAAIQGCHDGYVTDLATNHLHALTGQELGLTRILACGPEPMLAATAKLAQRFDVECQLALEEFMACGVGGCAGCTVEVVMPEGVAMKRVCVDGPVFPAESIYPNAQT